MFYFPTFVEEELIPSEEVRKEVESFRNTIKEIQPLPQKNIIGNCDINLIELLLIKYVYYKIIVGDNAKAEKLLLLTTDNIIDGERNILIPDKDLEKCWQVLTLFNYLKRKYSRTFGIPWEFSEIQNYDKFITKNFINNITKIDPIIIPESCENWAKYNPIILPSKKHFNNKLLEKSRLIAEYCEPDNVFSDANLVIDWLFQNCEHVETFEIGIFAATSQALYVTEGFDAFKKFLAYTENLSDENRIKFVNILIKLFNNFIRKVDNRNYFHIIPEIIMTLDLCDKILQYPVSVAESVFEAETMNPTFKDFMLKSNKKYNLFTKVIYNFRNNSKNTTKTQTFGREKTIPMQAIISEYDKL